MWERINHAEKLGLVCEDSIQLGLVMYHVVDDAEKCWGHQLPNLDHQAWNLCIPTREIQCLKFYLGCMLYKKTRFENNFSKK